MAMRQVDGDNVRVMFKCDDCGYEDWASVNYILDNGCLVCSCGCDMTSIGVEIKED